MPDPALGAARRGRAGRGDRPVPQRLARLDGPRPGHPRSRTCPGTSSPASSRRSATGSRGGRRATGSRCRSCARCGTCRAVPRRRPAGLRPPDPARLHALGLVRRARRARPRRRQPRRAARTASAFDAAAAPRLPVRHRLPRGPAGGRVARRRVGRGPRLRRRRAVGGDDRGGGGRAGRGRRRRRRRRWPARASWAPSSPSPARQPTSASSPAAAPTSRSTRSAARRRARPRSPACASAAGTSRSACCPDAAARPDGPRHRRELEILGSHGMAAHAYPAMLALVAAGRLRPGDLVTSRIGLDEAPAALVAMTDGSPDGITVIRP